MKRLIKFISAFVTALCILPFSVLTYAQDEMTFTLSPGEINKDLCTVDVKLKFSGNPGISSGEFNIFYNSKVLRLDQCSFEYDGLSRRSYPDDGRLNIRYEKEEDLKSKGTLLNLSFSIKSTREALTGITMEFISLKDENGQDAARKVKSCFLDIPSDLKITKTTSSSETEAYKSAEIEKYENEFTAPVITAVIILAVILISAVVIIIIISRKHE